MEDTITKTLAEFDQSIDAAFEAGRATGYEAGYSDGRFNAEIEGSRAVRAAVDSMTNYKSTEPAAVLFESACGCAYNWGDKFIVYCDEHMNEQFEHERDMEIAA